MKLAIIFMVVGLIISVSWVAWGFLPMLAILLTTLILGAIGYVLDIMGYSLNKFTSKMLEKISNEAPTGGTIMTTTNQTTKNAVDQQLTFDDQVIEKIAGITVSRVPGIVSLDGNMFSEFADKVTSGTSVTKGIKVDAGEKQAAVKMDATIEYGKSAPEIFKAACQEVATALEQMTGLKLVKFELHINDVKTREELANDNKKEKEVA